MWWQYYTSYDAPDGSSIIDASEHRALFNRQNGEQLDWHRVEQNRTKHRNYRLRKEVDNYHILYGLLFNNQSSWHHDGQVVFGTSKWVQILKEATGQLFNYVNWYDIYFLTLLDFRLGEDLVSDGKFIGRSCVLCFEGGHISIPTNPLTALTLYRNSNRLPPCDPMADILERRYFFSAFEEERRKKDFELTEWESFITADRWSRMDNRILQESTSRLLKSSSGIKITSLR